MRADLRSLVLLILVVTFLQGCTVKNLLNAQSYMESNDFENAVISCEKALESNRNNPLHIPVQGKKINVDYFSYICLGYSHMALGNYDSSTKNLLRSVGAFPELAHEGYFGLAELNYQQGNKQAAYDYIVKATRTLDSPIYREMEKGSGFPEGFWKNLVEGAKDFYELRLRFEELEYQMGIGNYRESVRLAEQIVNRHYKVYVGADAPSPTVALVLDGGMADLNGLISGDTILEVAGHPISNMQDLAVRHNELVEKYGSTVPFKLERKGRVINLEAKLVYPEIEQAKYYLAEALERLEKPKEAGKVETQGPWIKVLEPKPARGIKIVTDQTAAFAILASAKERITTVTVNDVACTVSEANALEKTMLPGKVARYSVSLPLRQGKNQFSIRALDARGKTAQQVVEVEGSEASVKPLDRIYDHQVAVVIGVNKYPADSAFAQLEFAVNDARSVKKKLLSMGYDKIIELYDEKATRSAILRVLGDDLVDMLGPNDALLVYFAGHGVTEALKDGEEEGYIVPVDAIGDRYAGTAISMAYLHSMIKKYQAKHILFAFDSCYSGLGLKRGGAKRTENGYVMSMAQKKVRQIMTAGGKEELAHEHKGHGVFTRAFLDALDGELGGASNDGFVFATEVGPLIRKEVAVKTNHQQTPMFGTLDGEGDFIFDLTRSPVPADAAAAPASSADASPGRGGKGKRQKR